MTSIRVACGIAGFALLSAVIALGCSDEPGTSASGSSGSTSTSSGAGGAGGAGGGASDEYATYCQDAYDRDVKCNEVSDQSAVDACLMHRSCDEALYRDGVLPLLHTCLVARPCMEGDDSCLAEVAEQQDDTQPSKQYGEACLGKAMTCQMAGTPFTDDYCYNYTLIKDSILDELRPCFDLACNMITACIKDVLDPIAAPCSAE